MCYKFENWPYAQWGMFSKERLLTEDTISYQAQDLVSMFATLPAAKKKRFVQSKWSLLTNREFPLGARKPLSLGKCYSCFMSEASWDTATFFLIYLFIVFIFHPHPSMEQGLLESLSKDYHYLLEIACMKIPRY